MIETATKNIKNSDAKNKKKSILESELPIATRPYSQRELNDIRSDTKRMLRLSVHQAEHGRCRHFYNVKKGGRKEEKIIENLQNTNVGACSVCWKIENTPQHLIEQAMGLCDDYMYYFEEKEPEKLTYDMVMTERIFYIWLYEK